MTLKLGVICLYTMCTPVRCVVIHSENTRHTWTGCLSIPLVNDSSRQTGRASCVAERKTKAERSVIHHNQ